MAKMTVNRDTCKGCGLCAEPEGVSSCLRRGHEQVHRVCDVRSDVSGLRDYG